MFPVLTGKLLFAHSAQRPLLVVGAQLGTVALFADSLDVPAGADLRPATFGAVVATLLVVGAHDAFEVDRWTLVFAEHFILGHFHPDVSEVTRSSHGW